MMGEVFWLEIAAMNPYLGALLVGLLVAVVLVALALIATSLTYSSDRGWSSHQFGSATDLPVAGGEVPSWTPSPPRKKNGDPRPVSSLRFRNAVFKIYKTQSDMTAAEKAANEPVVLAQRDVTTVLNAMAAAYGVGDNSPQRPGGSAGGNYCPPTSLDLSGPLNAFSFNVDDANFKSSDYLADSPDQQGDADSDAKKFANEHPVTLDAQYRTLGGVKE